MAAARIALVAIAVVVAVLALPAAAVSLEPGRPYPGGTRLDIPSVGLSIEVPQGWNALLPAGASLLIMTPDQRQYLFLVAEQAGREQALAYLSAPIPLGNGITLVPDQAAVAGASDIRASYRVQGGNGALAASVHARLLDSGYVLGAFAVAPPELLAAAESRRDRLLVNLEQIPVVAADDDWQSYLRGRHLVRYYSGSGYHEETHLYLCADGHFRRHFGSGGFTSYGSGAASGAGSSQQGGRWRASGRGKHGSLHLVYADGRESEIALSYEDGKLFLDGTRMLRDPENRYCP